jgi:hypothetical protein
MTTLVRILICAVLVLAATEARAAVPGRVNFTARLVDGTTAAQGQLQLTLQLYRAATGGSSIWTETHTVTATDGLVALTLGDQTALDANIVDGSALHLELIVDGTVLSPRLPLGSVPYAMLAERAQAADKLGTLGPDDVQRRILGTCAPGSSVRSIDASGAVTCEPDDDTTYTFGNGLTVSGTDVSVDATIQRRVGGTCPTGSSINAIALDGTVTCELDDNTTYTAGTGIAISGSNTITPDFAIVQRRVGGCAAGSSIRSVNADGSVICEADTAGPTYSVACPTGEFVRALSSTGAVTCASVTPTTITVTSTAGTSASSTPVARSFCALTVVRGINVDDPRCALTLANGLWTLTADSSSTLGSQMTCEARCF